MWKPYCQFSCGFRPRCFNTRVTLSLLKFSTGDTEVVDGALRRFRAQGDDHALAAESDDVVRLVFAQHREAEELPVELH